MATKHVMQIRADAVRSAGGEIVTSAADRNDLLTMGHDRRQLGLVGEQRAEIRRTGRRCRRSGAAAFFSHFRQKARPVRILGVNHAIGEHANRHDAKYGAQNRPKN